MGGGESRTLQGEGRRVTAEVLLFYEDSMDTESGGMGDASLAVEKLP